MESVRKHKNIVFNKTDKQHRYQTSKPGLRGSKIQRKLHAPF